MENLLNEKSEEQKNSTMKDKIKRLEKENINLLESQKNSYSQIQ